MTVCDVLYVAGDDETAREGAAALAEAGSSLSTEPATSVEAVRERAPDADCVVFAETPTTPEGAHLLEVVEAAGGTPLVLFTDASYAPTAARSTDGIDGYVRRESGAFAHLVDEIRWCCHGSDADARGETGPSADSKIDGLHEMATRIVACREERRLFDLAIETAEDVLAFDASSIMIHEEREDGPWLVPRATETGASPGDHRKIRPDEGLAGKTFRRGRSFRVDDLREDDDARPADDSFGSAISVPIGDRGVFQAASTDPAAFDDEDVELAEILASHVGETLARLEVERELVTERDRFSALFENVPDPVVRCEFVDGRVVVRDVNAAFESTFGFDRETVVGEDIDDYLVPSGYEDEAGQLNETIRRGEPFTRTTRRRTADEVRDFRVTLVPVELGERSPEGFAIYTDVTEQKRRERELAARNERLDEFASIVSHDLRGPLNVARGYLELAEETGDPEHVAEVERAHERMETLIDRLLTLAKRGEFIAETEPVALHDVARRAWAAVDDEAASLELERDAILEADKTRLRELLDNLVRNAVEHGGEGPLTVRIGATDDGFYVADDGAGIPEDERDDVFESGYTTAEDGTGYGLAIVDRIAAAHGWTVSVGESADGGARFEIRGADVEWIGADDLA